MILFYADLVAIVVLGFLVVYRGRDRRIGGIRLARWLRIVGLLPLGLQVVIYLLFGIGEMASGDLSGAGHLLQVAVTVPLGILAWMRPLEGGSALFIVGLIVGVITSSHFPASRVISPAIMIMAVPKIVAGALFFIAGMLGRGATSPKVNESK